MKWWSRLFGGRTQPDRHAMAQLLELTNRQSQPNLNALARIAREVEPISLNLKHFGYDLARRLAAAIPIPTGTAAQVLHLPWKASVQRDIESEWVAHWAAELKVPVVYHRKLWELAYVLQAIHDAGLMVPGARGLGFGCGIEPITSYLAAQDISVTVTDLPADDAQAVGWAATQQHTAYLADAFHPHLVDRQRFDANVGLRYVDMNAIPDDLRDYDFCWSICALEHVGSIEKGIAFIENALLTLRPGGMAVHTTEYNIRADGPTIDNWPTVLFQKRHFETLADRLRRAGHQVAELDFDLGNGPMDRFIDLPPWSHDLPTEMNDWLGSPAHLKLTVDGMISTCFGLSVRKAG